MRDLLDRYTGPIAIISGEGLHGTAELHTGARTRRAIRARLTRERTNGDRWSRAVVYAGVNHGDEPIGIDLSTCESCDWPSNLPRGAGRPLRAALRVRSSAPCARCRRPTSDDLILKGLVYCSGHCLSIAVSEVLEERPGEGGGATR